MARWCFRPCTARFTLAIELLLPPREHDAVSASRRASTCLGLVAAVPGWHDGTPPFLRWLLIFASAASRLGGRLPLTCVFAPAAVASATERGLDQQPSRARSAASPGRGRPR